LAGKAGLKSNAENINQLSNFTCPNCGSSKLWKDGFRNLNNEVKVQRFYCRECQYRFSEKALDAYDHDQKDPTHLLNGFETEIEMPSMRLESPNEKLGRSGNRMSQSRTEKWAAGATEIKPTLSSDVRSLLLKFAWWMKKEGYSESTIITRGKLLETLTKRSANLLDPESVKETIAVQKWCNKRKINAADAYTSFLRMQGLT